MPNSPAPDLKRPYLVIPKLIEQPTWGGDYIAGIKHWQDRPAGALKIGQSYELFSGSNLSLCMSSSDPAFDGELTDRDAVKQPDAPPDSLPLASLVAASDGAVVGTGRRQVDLLIKFTQALGNSFQLHIKDGLTDPYWKPKPESWYFFEPGSVTLGVRPDVDWEAYAAAVRAVDAGMQDLSRQVRQGGLGIEEARPRVKQLLDRYDPWGYVNRLPVPAGQLIDLSAGGTHHSWEEDPVQAPLGNVLYELQLEAYDDDSTIRNFDKGKMAADGSVRRLQVDDYFRFIDRSAAANDPQNHMRQPVELMAGDGYTADRLMESRYYTLDRLVFAAASAPFQESITGYRHLFVRSGTVAVTGGGTTVEITAGHSCFVPATAAGYTANAAGQPAEVLVSFQEA